MLSVAVEGFICGDEAEQYSHSVAQKIRQIRLNFNGLFKALLLGEVKEEGKKGKGEKTLHEVGKCHFRS